MALDRSRPAAVQTCPNLESRLWADSDAFWHNFGLSWATSTVCFPHLLRASRLPLTSIAPRPVTSRVCRRSQSGDPGTHPGTHPGMGPRAWPDTWLEAAPGMRPGMRPAMAASLASRRGGYLVARSIGWLEGGMHVWTHTAVQKRVAMAPQPATEYIRCASEGPERVSRGRGGSWRAKSAHTHTHTLREALWGYSHRGPLQEVDEGGGRAGAARGQERGPLLKLRNGRGATTSASARDAAPAAPIFLQIRGRS